MKTSHILLLIIAVVTLTGMVAADVLLKQQYDRIDWNDKYQDFERRTLFPAQHLVIESAPIAEVIIERGTGASQALLLPSMADSYRAEQRGDTVFVRFTMNYREGKRSPRDYNYEMEAGLVLRLPRLQSVRFTNGGLTLRNLVPAQLTVDLQNSRLRMDNVTVAGPFTLVSRQNSFAALNAGRYASLRAVVQDSSGVQLNDVQTEAFTSELSPRAEVQLRGRAVQWVK